MAESGIQNDLNVLSDALYEAYWAATTAEGKDIIRNAEKQVDNAIVAADVKAIEDRTAAFEQLAKDIPQLNETLSNLQKEIKTIVKNTQTVATVLGAIAKVLPYMAAM